MVYIPGIPLDLDYPEILGLRVPLPTLVQNDEDDQLFTIGEMRRADRILGEVYAKAGAGRPLQVLVLPWPAQVRPSHAGRGLRLVRALAEVVRKTQFHRPTRDARPTIAPLESAASRVSCGGPRRFAGV